MLKFAADAPDKWANESTPTMEKQQCLTPNDALQRSSASPNHYCNDHCRTYTTGLDFQQ